MEDHAKRLRWESIVLLPILAGGCQTFSSLTTSDVRQDKPMSATELRVSRQLIIKFTPGTIACDADGIAGLSASTHVTLSHVRPMSGEACVIKQTADSESGLSQDEERLRQHPAVEWVEEDRLMKPLSLDGARHA
jgi:hypothetical protein